MSKCVDGAGFEELVAPELKSTLQEVSGNGWSESCSKSPGSLTGYNLPQSTEDAAVVCPRLQLDPRFDAKVASAPALRKVGLQAQRVADTEEKAASSDRTGASLHVDRRQDGVGKRATDSAGQSVS